MFLENGFWISLVVLWMSLNYGGWVYLTVLGTGSPVLLSCTLIGDETWQSFYACHWIFFLINNSLCWPCCGCGNCCPWFKTPCDGAWVGMLPSTTNDSGTAATHCGPATFHIFFNYSWKCIYLLAHLWKDSNHFFCCGICCRNVSKPSYDLSHLFLCEIDPLFFFFNYPLN